jgi:hypothetical protein
MSASNMFWRMELLMTTNDGGAIFQKSFGGAEHGRGRARLNGLAGLLRLVDVERFA